MLYHAQGDAFDLVCESLCIASLIVCEGFRRKWPLPGGEALLLELIPTVFLHIYRVLCVHKLKRSLSKTVIGHSYSFLPANATLLAPSPLEEAMLKMQLTLKARVIQVQAEPSSQWSVSLPSTAVDCIRMLHVLCPICPLSVFLCYFCRPLILVRCCCSWEARAPASS